jgi:abortive infection bacteriophage resistance protein
MKYNKPHISFEEQILKLIERKLIINDKTFASKYLSSISFYRLRAYTYPFQDNTKIDHPFINKITFEEIIEIYNFDYNLRNLIFSALGHIEVGLRTQIIYQFSKTYGSHWQLNPNIYRDTGRFAKHIQTLNEEVERSDETFIKHYKEKYLEPEQPASWMSIEVASFGLLSKIFQNLKRGKEKTAVVNFFGLKREDELENWMLCFSNLRNICAHHSRLWNRRLTSKPTLPYNTINPFLSKINITRKDDLQIYPNKVYAIICCIVYLLNQINTENSFKNNLIDLLKNCPINQEKEMGFPKDWKTRDIWQN